MMFLAALVAKMFVNYPRLFITLSKEILSKISKIILFSVVSQFYESQVYDEYVIKGNAAVLKCHLPSFIVDHVEITEWIDSDGGHYKHDIAGNI